MESFPLVRAFGVPIEVYELHNLLGDGDGAEAPRGLSGGRRYT